MDDTTHGHIPSRKTSGKGKGMSWARDNPMLVKLAVFGGLFLVFLIVVAVQMLSSGGNGPRPSNPPATAAAPTPPPAVANAAPAENESQPATDPGVPDQQTETTSQAAANDQPEEEEGEEEEEEEEEEEAPERPENLADWKTADYFSARAEDDPRLVEAVKHLGQRFVGKESAARMLANLLERPEEEEEEEPEERPPGASRPQVAQGNPQLIEAVVEAIHVNATAEARRILEQLLAAARPTESDEATVDAVLKTLVEHPGPQYDTILLRALTEAQKLRPEGRGELTADELRSQTLELVKSNASEPLRTELAKRLVRPTTPPQLRSTLGEFLQQDHPGNLGAQLVLYGSQETPKQTKAKLEEYFAAYSSQTVAKILGVSAQATGASGRGAAGYSSPTRSEDAQAAPADPEAPFRIARQLWGDESVAMIAGRLATLESLEKEPNLVALARTVPVDAVRAGLVKALGKHWEDGPKTLGSTGTGRAVVTDPGFLVLAKVLARRQITGRAGTQEARDRILQVKQEWTSFSDALVRTWCERLRGAASAQAQADPATLPITLRAGAKPAAEYHLLWPGNLAEKLAGVTTGEMEIHYVRIEEKDRLITTVGYYARQLGLRTNEVRPIDKTRWLESLRILRDTGRRRSTNVLITSSKEEEPTADAANRPQREADETEDLVIEILSIEIADPQK